MMKRAFLLAALLVLLLTASSTPEVQAQGLCEYFGCAVVNSIGDDGDAVAGDGVCATAANPDECTLRAAIEETNHNSALNAIVFDPGEAPYSIPVIRELPDITQPVYIDGTGVDVELTGCGTVVSPDPDPTLPPLCYSPWPTAFLKITAGSSMVRELAFRGIGADQFLGGPLEGVVLGPGGGNIIEDNTLTDLNTAISIVDSPDNTIGPNNVISANGRGLTIAGSSASNNTVVGNVIGDATDPEQGNGAGVAIILDASDNTVGPDNVISGNGSGVFIGLFPVFPADHGNATGNVVEGNYIGTDASGTTAAGNIVGVIMVSEWPTEPTTTSLVRDNVIGGTGGGNVISGNDFGIWLWGSGTFDNTVAGNFIGTDSTGTLDLGNEQSGVLVSYGSSDNFIWDNVIAYNGSPGMEFGGIGIWNGGTGNAIRGNNIYENTGLGIDLAPVSFDPDDPPVPDGVTPNDELDGDTGPNDLQNFPYLDAVTTDGSNTTVYGRLYSKPNTDYILEGFSSTSCDESGYGEGETFRGVGYIYTFEDGGVAGSDSGIGATPVGDWATATITDPDGNTSEFSACTQVMADSDNDSIVDVIDTAPSQISEEFYAVIDGQPPITGGVKRGDKQFIVRDDPDGVRILAYPYLGTDPTTFTVCGGLDLIPPVPPPYEVMDVLVTCPASMQIEVIEGSVEIQYTLIDGSLLSIVLAEGYGLTVDPDTLSFSAPDANPGPISVFVGSDEIVVYPGTTEIRQATIDIKPGSDPNCFNNDGHGVIPVAILSTSFLDATSIDPVSVSLDGQDVRVVGNGKKTQAHVEDVNGDGLDDLVVQIEDVDGTYQQGESVAKLTGTTLDELTSFVGYDDICVVQ